MIEFMGMEITFEISWNFGLHTSQHPNFAYLFSHNGHNFNDGEM